MVMRCDAAGGGAEREVKGVKKRIQLKAQKTNSLCKISEKKGDGPIMLN